MASGPGAFALNFGEVLDAHILKRASKNPKRPNRSTSISLTGSIIIHNIAYNYIISMNIEYASVHCKNMWKGM